MGGAMKLQYARGEDGRRIKVDLLPRSKTVSGGTIVKSRRQLAPGRGKTPEPTQQQRQARHIGALLRRSVRATDPVKALTVGLAFMVVEAVTERWRR